MMVTNLFAGAQPMQLSRVILIYRNNVAAVATLHEIVGKDSEPLLGAGVPITRDAIETTLRELQGAPASRALLPENVLCADGGRMAWWKSSFRGPIFFNTRDEAFNKGMAGALVQHPTLLFLADAGGRLSIFALAEDARPMADTKLYRAPYFNLYAKGLMCAGNVRLPEVPVSNEIPIWERAFFETTFTHANIHSDRLTTHSGDHNGFWRAMRDERNPKPSSWLVPLEKTVEEMLNEEAGQRL
jgi:PRTRC genetic system protein B